MQRRQKASPERLENNLFLRRAFLLSVFIRLLLLCVAIAAGYWASGNLPDAAFIRGAFSQWDAPHYLRLAEVGYSSTGEDALFIVFFPLYPFAVSIAHYFFADYVAAGLLVSFAFSVAATYALYRLVRVDYSREQAELAVLYFLFFPTAYFLALPYTESIFIALCVTSFFFARKGRFFEAGILGMLASAARLQGVMLFPALAVEAFMSARSRNQRLPRASAWILLVPLGLLFYLAISHFVLGSPTAFIETQKSHWHHSFVFPWESIGEAVRAILNDPPSEFRFIVYETRLAAIAFAVLVLGSAITWLRPAYSVFAWGQFLPLLFDSWPLSIPRYLLAIFPVFIILALLPIGRRGHAALLALSAAAMLWFYSLYAVGRWAF